MTRSLIPLKDIVVGVADPLVLPRVLQGHRAYHGARVLASALVIALTFGPFTPLFVAHAQEGDEVVEIVELVNVDSEPSQTTMQTEQVVVEEPADAPTTPEESVPSTTVSFESAPVASLESDATSVEGIADTLDVVVSTSTDAVVANASDSTSTSTEPAVLETLNTEPSQNTSIPTSDISAIEVPETVTTIQKEQEQREEHIRVETERAVRQQLTQNCLEFGGGFYCVTDTQSAGDGVETPNSMPSVFSAQHVGETDAEIFMRNDVLPPIRLTENTEDDLFPVLDRAADAIAWQGLVGGVWQIFSYDIKTATSTQLTSGPFNAMHPSMESGRLVWQEWVDGNWEIFFARPLDSGAPGFKVEQITDNGEHDMFPKIEGGLIVWQSRRGSAWQVDAYRIVDGTIIELTNGLGKHERPRFALVWDEVDENGRIATMQHDPESGMTTPVAAPTTSSLPFTPTLPDNPAPASEGAIPPPVPSLKEGDPDANAL